MNAKTRRIAAIALAAAVLPFTAGQASAATKTRIKRTPSTAVATTTAAPTTTTTAAAPVTSVISIGGYVFYNMTYLEAVDAWAAAVAAAPAGYVPPVVTSVSISTTVSGTVENGNG